MFQLLKQKSMFVALHSDINSLKSGLLHLTGMLNFQKGGLTEVKDIIILKTKFLVTVSYINFGKLRKPDQQNIFALVDKSRYK